MTGSEPAEQPWQGVAAEEVEDLDRYAGLALRARSRRLLGSLLRPHLGRVALALLLVLGENLASLAGPLLIGTAIDAGITAALAGDTTVLAACVGGYLVAAMGSAGLRTLFQLVSGRLGQDV